MLVTTVFVIFSLLIDTATPFQLARKVVGSRSAAASFGLGDAKSDLLARSKIMNQDGQTTLLPTNRYDSKSNSKSGGKRETVIRMMMSNQQSSAGSKKISDDDIPSSGKSLVKNFRNAKGFTNIYRCASTDLLGDLFADESKIQSSNENNQIAEKVLLNEAELILDLRSPSERNETNARKWMSNANGGKFEVKYFERGDKKEGVDFGANAEPSYRRIVYRIDVLSPNRLFDYMAKNWLSPSQSVQYSFNAVFDGRKLHELRMDVLNERGLKGLYEAIIETSGEEMFAALKSIVRYFESLGVARNMKSSCREGGVVVHCVQGKDRTGLLIMLCQSILGLDDESIISDYHQSEIFLNIQGSSREKNTSAAASMATKDKKGKLSREIFSGSPRETMESTLLMIRKKYGSVEGYLDFIGFDSTWRDRFLKATQSCDAIIPNSDIRSKL